MLGQDGAYIDAIYYCPHHPDKGFAGERPQYKIECDCRKPRPGMLLQAADDYNIDMTASWMVGDSDSDIKAGTAAGCKTLLLDGQISLLQAIEQILDGGPATLSSDYERQ